VGWSAQMLWGWRDPEVIAWPGSEIELAERGVAFPQPNGPVAIRTGRYGLYALKRGQRTGLKLQVTEGETALGLLPSVDEAPRETLRIAFTTRDPEAYFAVPDAGLIFRLNQLDDTVQIQAYRSPSGDLLVEHQLQADADDFVLPANGATATIKQTLLPRYEVVYNPGAVFEAVGMALMIAGCIAVGKQPVPEGDDDPAAENETGAE